MKMIWVISFLRVESDPALEKEALFVSSIMTLTLITYSQNKLIRLILLPHFVKKKQKTKSCFLIYSPVRIYPPQYCVARHMIETPQFLYFGHVSNTLW